MQGKEAALHRLDRALVWAGFKELVPLSLFVIVFGAAFGLAATQAGLTDSASVLMSTLVFAGASQFAALELWGPQVPLFTMLVTVFAINARHLLMGATLYPWLRPHSPARRYAIMLVASDANWALAMQAFGNGRPGLGLLIWAVAAGASLLAFYHLPENSHVVVGAIAGGLVGLAWGKRE